MKTEILFGIHPVIEALRAARREISEVYLAKDKISKRIEMVLSLIESSNISIKKVGASRLSTIAQTDMHQGLGAKVSPYPTPPVTDILDRPGDGNYFFLLLDSVVDPRNLGALVRTALCVGIDGVVIPKDRSASPTPVVSKASSGALEHVFLSRVTNLVDTIKTLKEKGLDKNTDIYFISDNGSKRGTNYPLAGIKHDVLEGGMRVPFIVWSDAIASSKMAGKHYDGLVSVCDVLPTCYSLATGQGPEGIWR